MDVTLGAARLADGAVADAVVRVDWTEHQRRLGTGLAAVTDLHALDRLLTFPLHELVAWPDLTPDDAQVLKALPEGAVEFTETGVRRVFAPAADVDVVIARSSRWQTGLRTAAAFAPFARRVLLLPRAPRLLHGRLWEADMLGVGVRIGTLTEFDEVLPPARWKRRFVKAAGWRFRERAYAAWRSAQPTQCERPVLVSPRP